MEEEKNGCTIFLCITFIFDLVLHRSLVTVVVFVLYGGGKTSLSTYIYCYYYFILMSDFVIFYIISWNSCLMVSAMSSQAPKRI